MPDPKRDPKRLKELPLMIVQFGKVYSIIYPIIYPIIKSANHKDAKARR